MATPASSFAFASSKLALSNAATYPGTALTGGSFTAEGRKKFLALAATALKIDDSNRFGRKGANFSEEQKALLGLVYVPSLPGGTVPPTPGAAAPASRAVTPDEAKAATLATAAWYSLQQGNTAEAEKRRDAAWAYATDEQRAEWSTKQAQQFAATRAVLCEGNLLQSGAYAVQPGHFDQVLVNDAVRGVGSGAEPPTRTDEPVVVWAVGEREYVAGERLAINLTELADVTAAKLRFRSQQNGYSAPTEKSEIAAERLKDLLTNALRSQRTGFTTIDVDGAWLDGKKKPDKDELQSFAENIKEGHVVVQPKIGSPGASHDFAKTLGYVLAGVSRQEGMLSPADRRDLDYATQGMTADEIKLALQQAATSVTLHRGDDLSSFINSDSAFERVLGRNPTRAQVVLNGGPLEDAPGPSAPVIELLANLENAGILSPAGVGIAMNAYTQGQILNVHERQTGAAVFAGAQPTANAAFKELQGLDDTLKDLSRPDGIGL